MSCKKMRVHVWRERDKAPSPLFTLGKKLFYLFHGERELKNIKLPPSPFPFSFPLPPSFPFPWGGGRGWGGGGGPPAPCYKL